MKILHCADLHISAFEEAYAFSVLDEVIDVAGRERVGLLLFAGDTFDSYDDAEAFRDRFARHLALTIHTYGHLDVEDVRQGIAKATGRPAPAADPATGTAEPAGARSRGAPLNKREPPEQRRGRRVGMPRRMADTSFRRRRDRAHAIRA